MSDRWTSDDKVPGAVSGGGERRQRVGRFPRPTWLLGGVLALVLAVLALYGVFDTQNTPTATQPPIAGFPPTTRTDPSNWVDSLVCESLPTTAAELPEATGTELIIVTKFGEVLHLDLGNGRLSCVRPVSTPAVDRPPWVWGLPEYVARTGTGTLIHAGNDAGGVNWFVPDDSSLPAQELDEVGWSYWPAVAPDTLWEYYPGPPSTDMRLLDLATGQRSADLTPPSGGYVRGSDGAGQLVVHTRTDLLALAPDGTTTTLWEGNDLLAVNAGTILGRICDTATSCRLVTVDRRSGEWTDLGPALEALTLSNPTRLRTDPAHYGLIPVDLTLSPDGTLLAGYGLDPDQDFPSGREGPMIFDLRTGETHQLETGILWPGHIFSWSEDSSMLFWVDHDGVVRLWRRDQPSDPLTLAAEILPPVRAVIVDR